MILLDGKATSAKVLEKVKAEVSKLVKKPHLVVILVGDNPASKIYVRNKQRAAWQVGIKSTVLEYDNGVTEEELIKDR